MKYLYSLALAFVLCINAGFAQMPDGNFGDEWINFNQSYFKIPVAEDGVYRISQSALVQAGIPVSQIATGNYQLFRLGEQVPIYVSASGLLDANDYIEFYGKKNRSELDRQLFANPEEEMLNPEYSLVTDTMSYFLTWVSGSGNNSLRFVAVDNDLSSPPSSERYFWYDLKKVYTNAHIKKKVTTDGTYFSDYNETEGFGSPFLLTTEHTIQPVNPVITGPASTFSTRFGSNLPANSGHNIAITLNNEAPVYEENFSGVALKKVTVPVSNSLLTNDIEVKFTGTGGTNDRHSVGVITLTYPRSFDFGGETSFAFSVEASSDKKLLDIENFSDAMGSPVLYDATNGLRIEAVVENGRTRIVLPPSATDRELILFEDNAAFTAINNLSESTFIDYAQNPATYLIISNSRLFRDAQGVNQVAEYANYRSSAVGGGFTTRVVNVEDLYNQYAYGINRHPLSIKNFIQKVKTQWEDLSYLLIIGKGREYHKVRTPGQVAGAQSTLFVPTYGFPGSDNLLTSENGQRFPAVATGRIAATSPEDIKIYLRKVRDLEAVQQNSNQTIEERAWMKQILHLGGGGNTGERDLIRRHLEGMEEIIESNVFGAEVVSVFKSSNDPVQQSKSEEIFDRINDGVSMITFFGHSGVGTFDFDIDNPDNYENYEKYPLMFSLGCYSGNIHTATRGVSERFVYYEDRGAIGFGATTGLGYISGLNPFMSRFYQLAGGPLYGQGMGDILRGTIEAYNINNNITLGPLAQQFTLQGDPAVKINPSDGADYVVDISSVSFSPDNILAEQDSFLISFRINNLGMSVVDSINIKIEHQLPNGEMLPVTVLRVATPKYQSTHFATLETGGRNSVGLNNIFILVDSDNEIDESPPISAENNNELRRVNGQRGIALYISDNAARPVYPVDYGIVSTIPELKASIIGLGSSDERYNIQIDTTINFNSDMLSSNIITQNGGVLKWTPEIPFISGTVYYWRVSQIIETSTGPEYKWENSSFLYKTGEPQGWNQSHYYQLVVNETEGISINNNSIEPLKFAADFIDLRVKNKLRDPLDPPNHFFNGGNTTVNPWIHLNNGFNAGVALYVLDPVTISSNNWRNSPGGDHGSINPNSTTRFFSFPTSTTSERENVINFIEEIIPDSHFFFMWTLQLDETSDYQPEDWAADSLSLGGKNLFNVMESYGAQQIRTLESLGSVPYGIIAHKGVEIFDEAIAQAVDETINIQHSFRKNFTEGEIKSIDIGPAQSWETFSWDVTNVAPSDTTKLGVVGIKADLSTDTLSYVDHVQGSINLSFIDATIYPSIRLIYFTKDEVERTPAQLKGWKVNYQGFGDLAINTSLGFDFNSDTLQQGQLFSLKIPVENISDYEIDSTTVKFTLTNSENEETIFFDNLSALTPGEVADVSFSTSTENIMSSQDIIIEVNPARNPKEQYHFNNIFSDNFYIDQDKINPILDVTFDGVHIMNGDIVSAAPLINISLKDENQFLALSDTSVIRMLLVDPEGRQTEIWHSSNNVTFTPATAPGEKAELTYQAEFLQDGTYSLIVQARDASDNSSGDLDYRISFEVITKRMISNVYNYPNPFSNSTSFVYTLTGSTSPEQFKIQIFTVSGKVIREITQDEIGPLKIGTHRTDFTWDGRDEYGDKLANGVYLYRVIANNDEGEEIDNYRTSADSFFKRGFSKMVILR